MTPNAEPLSNSVVIDPMGYAFAIGGAVLFSTKGIFIKLAYAHGVPTETVLALRMAVAIPIYLVVFLLLLRRLPTLHKALAPGFVGITILVGILGYFVSSYLDFLGLQFVSAQYERLVLFTYPFITLILGIWLFGDRFSWTVLPGMVISYAGIAVIFSYNLVAAPAGLFAGTALVLAAATTFALYQHLARRQMRTIGSAAFTCIGMTSAGLVAILHNGITHGPGSLLALDAPSLAYGLCLGIFGTVLPSFLMNAGIARIGARATASTAALGPVVTALIAVAVLGEVFTVFHAIGTVLVIAGAYWFGRAERRVQAAR
ncbi:hypothetical protein GCM10007989_20450 [Devosia pacifica]|uniref:EamA domain-containing protein n=1 Tax=Devosia pacifica TaxID=1335967 RepID=A0A918S502_9HYPH|nr:DMT family transporter [Devosia pacifica]GHA24697.1 hypothetical protein GCM10007989_20450 [Devosia pacifica]